MSWKDKFRKIDWFKNTNLVVGGFGWALVFIALMFTMVGSAHYLALYTDYHGMAWRILLFGSVGVGLIYIFYILEIIRNKCCKGDDE
jgi:hypothetical protein